MQQRARANSSNTPVVFMVPEGSVCSGACVFLSKHSLNSALRWQPCLYVCMPVCFGGVCFCIHIWLIHPYSEVTFPDFCHGGNLDRGKLCCLARKNAASSTGVTRTLDMLDTRSASLFQVKYVKGSFWRTTENSCWQKSNCTNLSSNCC